MKNEIETIEVDAKGEYVVEANESVVAEMKARLNPVMNKGFSYANGDHLKESNENEKKMRESK